MNIPSTSTGGADSGPFPPELTRGLTDFARWLGDNLWVVFLVAGLVLLLFLLLLILNLVAQGATARATADLALGRPSSLGSSWRAGSRLFWRYLGLWLALLGLGLLIVLVIGAIGGAVVLAFAADGQPSAGLIILAVLVAILLILLAIPLFIALGVAVGYAQRAIAVEDVGPLSALGTGFGLLRRNLGTSVIAWLISLVVGIVAAIAVLIGAFVLLVPLVAIGVALYVASGVSTALFAFAGVAVLILVVGLWVLSGIAGAYQWSYWTLVYLRLTDRLDPRLEAQPSS